MSRVFSIVNQKGGVGKTTTAVNLSAALAIGGNTVLLIDVDPQCSATSGVGIRQERGEASSYEVLLGHIGAEEALRKTMLPGLQLIPASRDLVGAEIELVPLDRRDHRLKEAIAEIRRRYDYVVIDCPPSLGLVTLNALTESDSILIPLQCEYYALEGLSDLVETLRKVRTHLNSRLEIEGLLRTMYNAQSTLTQQVSGELERHFGNKVYRTIVPRNVRLAEAPSYGKPVIAFDKSSKGAQAYSALAREILERVAP